MAKVRDVFSSVRLPVVLNRITVITIGCLAFASWNNWYKVVTKYGLLDTLPEVIGFTTGILILLASMIAWYLPRRERVCNRAKELLAGEAINLSDKKQLLAGMLEKGFVNLTDAMGYVMAEAWLTQLPAQPKNAILAALGVTLVCCSIIYAMEVLADMFPPTSNRRSILDMVAQILVGSCAWFVSDPMVLAYCRLFGVTKEDGGDEGLGIFFASLCLSIIFMQVVNYVQRNRCMKQGEDGALSDSEDEAVRGRVLFCENTVSMLKTVAFYTSARFLKAYVFSYEDSQSPFGLFIGFTIIAALVTVIMEQVVLLFLPQPPMAVSTLVIAYAQMNEVVSLSLRSLAWVSTKLFVAWGATVVGKRSRWVFAVLAIVEQLLAIIIEELRVSWLVEQAGQQSADSDESDGSGEDSEE